MATAARQYVFGYGSLLERRHEPARGLAELRGFRRTWNVAMDNRQTIPGYKHYIDRATGERGAWFVTFLNIVRDPGASVNGVMFAVDDALLERLDCRERNYERVDVTADVVDQVNGRVWAYVGSRDAEHRFLCGCRTGRAVISRDYYAAVREDFAAVGREALERFDALSDPPPCPILDLQRVDHGEASDRVSAITVTNVR
jgi:cation transport regulator ChaC